MIGMIGTILGLILGILFCHNINEIKALLELFTDSSIFAEEIYFFFKITNDYRLQRSDLYNYCNINFMFLCSFISCL